ncbi:MAG: DUF2330 domain-containing protein, partial [Myxococcaceae bacterium]|nr:DUF2330 domain-containing protein [Myxococcaceae bacterium]
MLARRGVRLLRLLRRRRRRRALQQRHPGRADARGQPHGALDAEQLPGPAGRLRDGGAGAGRPQEGDGEDAAPRRLRSHRHALSAPPRRVLGAGPLLRRAAVRRGRRLRQDGADEDGLGRSPGRRAAGEGREARFEVGEYDIVILSAKDALALETWLKQNKYKIPEGAEPLFRPYIQTGMKFFVAKVNAKKVTFEKGMAKLSPLRFHYDSEKFELPV